MHSYRSIIGYRSDNISTKYDPYFSGILATCNSRAPEVTSHTLFEEGDVMNILEEFWYGNIEPAEYDSCTTKEYTVRKKEEQENS